MMCTYGLLSFLVACDLVVDLFRAFPDLSPSLAAYCKPSTLNPSHDNHFSIAVSHRHTDLESLRSGSFSYAGAKKTLSPLEMVLQKP